jgi:hypothetical protein
MNNAHIESKAVTGGPSGVPSIVRRFAACVVIGVAAMSVAHAGPRDRDGDGQRDNRRGERMQQSEQRPQRADERQQRQYEPRQYESRQYDNRQYDNRVEDQRRNQQAQEQNSESRRSGRLTPDERRDLRRQINEAGADIYPNRPSRR